MSNAAEKLDQHEGVSKEKPKKSFSQIKISHPLDETFKSDFYAIEQPFIQITQEGYQITNKDRSEVYNAVRKRQLLKSFMVGVFAIAVFFMVLFGTNFIASLIFGRSELLRAILPAISILSFVIAWIASIWIHKNFLPIRLTTLFNTKDKKVIFHIEPSSGFFLFNHEYVLRDSSGRKIIYFRKRFIDSIFRKKWHAYTPKGQYMFSAVEDNIFLAFLRRYFKLGWLIPLHFNFNKGGGKPFGSFKRRLSIRDKYRLNHDPKAAPGWIIIAVSILLDTGEKR